MGSKILALDLSSTCTGYAVFNFNKTVKLLKFGQVFTEKGAPHGARYTKIKTAIRKLIREYGIKELLIESYYGGKGKGAAVCVELRGVIKELANVCKTPITEYAPATLKKQVAGAGKAVKEDIVDAVVKLFKLKIKKTKVTKKEVLFIFRTKAYTSDAADAIGLGVCHAKKIRKKPKFSY